MADGVGIIGDIGHSDPSIGRVGPVYFKPGVNIDIEDTGPLIAGALVLVVAALLWRRRGRS